jgi:hypothetical protein
MNRRPRYTLDDKPDFDDGEIVEIDTHFFGVPEEEAEYIECIVCGKHVMDHGFTLWVLNIGGQFSIPDYPYSCAMMPTYAIVKKEEQYAYKKI